MHNLIHGLRPLPGVLSEGFLWGRLREGRVTSSLDTGWGQGHKSISSKIHSGPKLQAAFSAGACALGSFIMVSVFFMAIIWVQTY